MKPVKKKIVGGVGVHRDLPDPGTLVIEAYWQGDYMTAKIAPNDGTLDEQIHFATTAIETMVRSLAPKTLLEESEEV